MEFHFLKSVRYYIHVLHLLLCWVSIIIEHILTKMFNYCISSWYIITWLQYATAIALVILQILDM